MNKKTVILGATPNPSRYAYIASHMLKEYDHEILPIGIKTGEVAGEEIHDLRQKPSFTDVDTVTLYLGPQNQPEWYDYILGLNPKRIIFNPGTENTELVQLARQKGIETVYGCTLVMLRAGTY
jgi:predicted CoA-binding protein